MTIIDPRVTEALDHFHKGIALLVEVQTEIQQQSAMAMHAEGRLSDVEHGLADLRSGFAHFIEQYTHGLAERGEG